MLKLIAMTTMFIDHAYYLFPNTEGWMTCIGRIAFPIFAFQAAEGIRRTHDIGKYIRRLFIFALISEIPFDLFVNGMMFYPFHQNVIFTLLIAVVTINCARKVAENKKYRWLVIPVLCLGMLLSKVMFTDYDWRGVATVMAFYICSEENKKINRKYRNAMLIILMMFLHIFTVSGFSFEFEILKHTVLFPIQGFALLAIIPVFLYNEKRGKYGKIMQKITYIFYPAHMLILYMIQQLYF